MQSAEYWSDMLHAKEFIEGFDKDAARLEVIRAIQTDALAWATAVGHGDVRTAIIKLNSVPNDGPQQTLERC